MYLICCLDFMNNPFITRRVCLCPWKLLSYSFLNQVYQLQPLDSSSSLQEETSLSQYVYLSVWYLVLFISSVSLCHLMLQTGVCLINFLHLLSSQLPPHFASAELISVLVRLRVRLCPFVCVCFIISRSHFQSVIWIQSQGGQYNVHHKTAVHICNILLCSFQSTFSRYEFIKNSYLHSHSHYFIDHNEKPHGRWPG